MINIEPKVCAMTTAMQVNIFGVVYAHGRVLKGQKALKPLYIMGLKNVDCDTEGREEYMFHTKFTKNMKRAG